LRKVTSGSMLPGGKVMQKFVHVVLTALGVAGLLLSTGCQTISTSHTCEVIGDRLPASDPARVEVLNDAPARRFARLGEIRAVSSTEEKLSKIQTALRQEAAKLGADALVIVKQGIHANPGDTPRQVVIGVAIKFL
jgi:hypothetical protein